MDDQEKSWSSFNFLGVNFLKKFSAADFSVVNSANIYCNRYFSAVIFSKN